MGNVGQWKPRTLLFKLNPSIPLFSAVKPWTPYMSFPHGTLLKDAAVTPDS
jgi:hypothetical protein